MGFVLTTLGDSSLRDGAGQNLSVPGLSLVFLAYLHDMDRPVARRQVASFLWPDRGEAAATNMRSMLRRLAMATDPSGPLVVADGTTLSLAPQAMRCDLAMSALTDPTERLKAATDAVALKFLPLHGDGSSALDAWVRDVRTRLVGQLRTEFMQFQTLPASDQRRSDLRRAAVLLLECDPDDEEVRRTISSPVELGEQQTAEVARPLVSFLPPQPANLQSSDVKTAFDITVPPRIALLPPETLHSAQQYGSVANALIEDLTIGLCTSRSVSVVAPYTAERIRASKDKAGILEKHSVMYALDTKRSDDQLFVQLIFMPSDEVLWATRFQLKPDEVAIQKLEIAEVIQKSIFDKVGGRTSNVADYHSRPDAYYAYLRGLQSLSKLDLPSIRKARRYFRQALDGDKSFSAARAGISRTLTMEWLLTARGDSELLQHAEEQAKIAVAENAEFAGAYKELGVSQLYGGKIDDSLAALGQAETFNPTYADVLYSHADSLVHASDPKAALDKISSAIALNPLSPDTYLWTAAGASYFLGEFRQALDYIGQMRDSAPASRLAAACWGMLGDMAKARSCRLRVLKSNPDFDLERWLKMVPHKEPWQTELYREGLIKAGF
jgi:DNA-binding SARP family transcriptional activator/tetratricopeptide (TPR) repeat protein